MNWLQRLFLGSVDKEKVTMALKRIEQLEAEQKLLKSGMVNLQSALIAITSNQEAVGHDMHRIQEALQEIFDGIQFQLANDSNDNWH